MNVKYSPDKYDLSSDRTRSRSSEKKCYVFETAFSEGVDNDLGTNGNTVNFVIAVFLILVRAECVRCPWLLA